MIGIIYSLCDESIYRYVSDFVEKLKDEKKVLKALGFVRSKKDTDKYLPKLTYDFFYAKNINWFGIPKGNYVKEFLNTEFDLVIDLSDGNSLPLQYIMARTNAKMNIGSGNRDSQKLYDIIIKRTEGSTLAEHIENIDHYLRILNPRTNSQ